MSNSNTNTNDSLKAEGTQGDTQNAVDQNHSKNPKADELLVIHSKADGTTEVLSGQLPNRQPQATQTTQPSLSDDLLKMIADSEAAMKAASEQRQAATKIIEDKYKAELQALDAKRNKLWDEYVAKYKEAAKGIEADIASLNKHYSQWIVTEDMDETTEAMFGEASKLVEKKILAYLKDGPKPARGMAEALKVSATRIRTITKRLEEKGVIEKTGLVPQHSYQLSSRGK